MAFRRESEKHRVRYPKHLVEPREWLNFVELDPFTVAWKRLGLEDEALRALQIAICMQPTAAPVMSGTGGLRKMRFAPAAWRTGQSGAARVYYSYFPDYGLVALIYVHTKSGMEAIDDRTKKVIKGLIVEIERFLAGRGSRKGKL